MAGVDAVISRIKQGKMPLCQDGMPLEPLDYLSLLFPNQGANATGNNVCFVQKRFQIQALRKLLPDPTEHFTPDDFVDSIVCFFVMCGFVTFVMLVCKLVWEKFDSRFASITPSHKKWYVVANMSKALLLAILALSHRYWLGTFKLYFYDQFQVLEIKRCGLIYIATDAVALYMVPKLPRSTWIHHISSLFLMAIVCSTNLDIKGWDNLTGVCKMAVLYAVFSSVAYSVNVYLALRVVYPKALWMKRLAKISLWIYLMCCACNWSIHFVWTINLLTTFQICVFNLLYMVVLATIIHDDIVLIRWLMNRSSPMSIESESCSRFEDVVQKDGSSMQPGLASTEGGPSLNIADQVKTL